MSDAARTFIYFLLREAKQAEDRARSLRATAATIEANNTIDERKIRKKRRRNCETKSQPKTQTAGDSVFFEENSESVEKDENSEKKNKEWGDLCDDQNQKQQSWESRGADELSSQQQEDKNDYRIEQRDKKSE